MTDSKRSPPVASKERSNWRRRLVVALCSLGLLWIVWSFAVFPRSGCGVGVAIVLNDSGERIREFIVQDYEGRASWRKSGDEAGGAIVSFLPPTIGETYTFVAVLQNGRRLQSESSYVMSISEYGVGSWYNPLEVFIVRTDRIEHFAVEPSYFASSFYPRRFRRFWPLPDEIAAELLTCPGRWLLRAWPSEAI